MNLSNPAFIDPSLDSRAVTFENPTGARGAGGTAHGGRKGAPNMRIKAGESVVLADLEGPGTIRHIWMTIPPAPPEHMRALWIEVFYDGLKEPSISVPFVDFFGLPHGRPAEYHSALISVQEGRGFNSYLPMPFEEHVRIVVTNGAARSMVLYYQVDYTVESNARRRRGLPPCRLPPPEPDGDEARTSSSSTVSKGRAASSVARSACASSTPVTGTARAR